MPSEKKVMLVTGSSGRIGKSIVHRFADDYTIVGFDRREHPHEKSMDHIQMDISSPESIRNGLMEVKKRYGTQLGPVVHLAAYYSFSGEKPELYETITVQGTKNLLTTLQELEFSVEQFHFASTLLVHAPCKVGETINEDSPVVPGWGYPKSKVRTEKIMHDFRGDIPIVVMRIAGCYDDQCHSIPIAHNIQRIYQHEIDSHLFPGDATHGNPFLHMDDLMDAYALTMEKHAQLPPELTMIVGEDRTMSYSALQNEISEILNGKDYALFRIPKWLAKEGAWVEEHLPFFDDNFIQPWMIDFADEHYALDITRAKEMIDWTPKHYIGDVLPVMLEQLKHDPLGWYEANGLRASKKFIKRVREEQPHV